MKRRFSIRGLLLLAAFAALIFALDHAIGAPVFLSTTVLSLVPFLGVRAMYRSGLRSAGIDLDKH